MSRPFGTIVKPFNERFWDKIKKDNPGTTCWLWTGGVDRSGYGQIFKDGHTVKSHREMYIFDRGPIPDGMNVLHTCDTPACVNPDHLWLGTQKDNADDMVAKGRHKTWTDPACLARGDRSSYRLHPESFPKGDDHPHTIIADAEVVEMRRIFDARKSCASAELITRFALQYHVSPSTIRAIVYRQRRTKVI